MDDTTCNERIVDLPVSISFEEPHSFTLVDVVTSENDISSDGNLFVLRKGVKHE
jgi:hypothetical protein